MNDIFFVSDLHINHSNIIRYSNRPFSNVEEMNEAIVENWNSLVKPDDTVYCLGDVAFMPYDKFKPFMDRFNGNIHLILGNHDKMIIEHKTELLHRGAFASIQDYKKLKTGGQTLILFHYSMRVWDGSHRGAIHLWGHSHGSLPPHGKSVDVGLDCKEITTEYRPVHLDEVLKYMEKRDIAVADHHTVK